MKLEIVQGPLPLGNASRAKYRVAQGAGDAFKVRVIDADSPTFTADFTAAFKANVRRVRRENPKLEAAE